MSNILERIQDLAEQGDLRISEHGYDELVEDGLSAREVVAGIQQAIVIEEYPDYPKGPCVLVFQRDRNQAPFHVVWGIPRGHDRPGVLITAYRPDPARWDSTLIRRH